MKTAMISPKNRPQGLQAQLQAYLNDVAAWLLQVGRPDLTKNLKDAVEARRSTTPTVVVIGETSRGKSSLVNALLNRTELSPTGLDSTTGCNVVLRHADHLQAKVRLIQTGEIVDIPIDEIEDWTTVEGNPDNQRGVFAVILGVDCPLLEQMTIVDTPGVGGLDAGHGALAAQAAAAADAVVLVVDPNAPISGPELRFLTNVAEKVDNVAIVLTKVEDYPEWRTMAQTDAQLVAAKAPRLAEAPVFPVSNLLALNPAYRAESGIGAVEQHLRARVAARTEVLRYANILRVAESCLAEVGRVERAQHAVLEAGEGTLEVLKAERARLDSVGVDGKKLVRDLDDGLRRLSLDRADGLNRGMRDLRTSYDEHVATLRVDAISALPAQLISDVTALADRLSEDARDRLTTLIEELILQVDAVAPELASLEQLYSGQLAESVTLDTPRKRAANRVERLSTLVSFSSGRSIGSLAASLPLIALGGAPFIIAGLGLGAVFAFHMHRGRGDVARQNEFKSWMREQLAEAERQLNNDFSRAMIDISHELRSALAERVETRKAEVGQAIRECEAAVAVELGQRKSQAEAIERRLADLQVVAHRGNELRTSLMHLDLSRTEVKGRE
jgi:GTPase SAR1 family protein